MIINMGKLKMINQGSIDNINDILNMAYNGDVKGVLVAGFKSDGSVITGFADLDVCQQATLIGHLQVDMMNRFIKNTYDVE
jgi:hypothetical protein